MNGEVASLRALFAAWHTDRRELYVRALDRRESERSEERIAQEARGLRAATRAKRDAAGVLIKQVLPRPCAVCGGARANYGETFLCRRCWIDSLAKEKEERP